MQNFDQYPIGSVEYWDGRVEANRGDLDSMIFVDTKREVMWNRTKFYLQAWAKLKVMDVCCGWGRFSEGFEADKYLGIDFSPKMIELARSKYPDKKFQIGDTKHPDLGDMEMDVIFEVNSLHSLGLTPDEFHEIYKGKAQVIACFEKDKVVFFYDW